MPKMVDRTGHRYGRLLVLGRARDRFTTGGNRKVVWLCQCDCGRLFESDAGRISSGRNKSCGCWNRELSAERKRTHGLGHTPEYVSWAAMKGRCLNPRNNAFADYGGRGIGMDPRWMRFEEFYKDMGPRPGVEYSLERIDNEKGYGPDNCKWATRTEQARNKRTSVWVTYRGQLMLASDLARIGGISLGTLRKRMLSGWPEDLWLIPPFAFARPAPR